MDRKNLQTFSPNSYNFFEKTAWLKTKNTEATQCRGVFLLIGPVNSPNDPQDLGFGAVDGVIAGVLRQKPYLAALQA